MDDAAILFPDGSQQDNHLKNSKRRKIFSRRKFFSLERGAPFAPARNL
jgi:hypothetical protein